MLGIRFPKPNVWSSYMLALSSKLGDVLDMGAELYFSLPVTPNMSGSAYSSVSLYVVYFSCVMFLSCLPSYNFT